MQLVSLGIYGYDGQRRDVNFKLGKLNILTGKSKTGKSAILDIVEYCLGRDTVTIPAGISKHVSWYFLIVQIRNERILLCRPDPETASTNRAMIKVGDLTLGPPDFKNLIVNADTDVLRDILTERLGIEKFTIEPNAGSLRTAFDVTVRQALFYCFQKQGEIASQDVLFHRQADNDVRVTIRDTLPYFIGSSTPEQAALRRQIIITRRSLQRVQNALRRAEAELSERGGRLSSLIRAAASLELLPVGYEPLSGDDVSALKSVLEYRASPSEINGDNHHLHSRQTELLEEIQLTRSRLREVDDQIEVLTRLQAEQSSSDEESEIQRDRLRALDFMLPKAKSDEGDAALCPLCDQDLPDPDETVDDLRNLLRQLERRLLASRGSVSRRSDAVDQLRAVREPLLAALREIGAELDAIALQEVAIAQGKERLERVAFLQGRVSQELERGSEIDQGLGELRDNERRLRGQLARQEDLYDRDNPEAALRAAMDVVSGYMTDYARSLRLEGSEFFVRLDPVELTVVVQEPNVRVPLERLGSGENWVGYHLVAHLALHRWFATQARPVPRFVMFDQPTQAFFPEEVVDASDDENADWEAVRRQFRLMRDVVSYLDGELQVIVCDHANLADEWFQSAVIDNWRNGVALMPSEWFDVDE